jgi:hypothetical protein
VAAGVLVATALAAVTWLGSDAPYRLPGGAQPELVVSFKHPGAVQGTVRERSAEELEKLPPHMRQAKVVERTRAHVRLRVRVDGQELLSRAYPPSGLWKDGNCVAIERFPLPPGRHEIELALGETAAPDEWTWQDARAVELEPRRRRVVTFERDAGFVWH